jgi:predicted DNA-binding transcriptional regulator AlpA
MNKNENLLDIKGVCDYFELSEATVRRLVKLSREGVGNFPLPIFPPNHVLRWRREQIENWNGESSVIEFTPSLTLPAHQPVQQTKNQAKTHRELKRKHGIDLSPQPMSKANG